MICRNHPLIRQYDNKSHFSGRTFDFGSSKFRMSIKHPILIDKVAKFICLRRDYLSLNFSTWLVKYELVSLTRINYKKHSCTLFQFVKKKWPFDSSLWQETRTDLLTIFLFFGSTKLWCRTPYWILDCQSFRIHLSNVWLILT